MSVATFGGCQMIERAHERVQMAQELAAVIEQAPMRAFGLVSLDDKDFSAVMRLTKRLLQKQAVRQNQLRSGKSLKGRSEKCGNR